MADINEKTLSQWFELEIEENLTNWFGITKDNHKRQLDEQVVTTLHRTNDTAFTFNADDSTYEIVVRKISPKQPDHRIDIDWSQWR